MAQRRPGRKIDCGSCAAECLEFVALSVSRALEGLAEQQNARLVTQDLKYGRPVADCRPSALLGWRSDDKVGAIYVPGI